MNYRQMEIFAAVLECGSVTAAATRLGLSQPAVSKSLKTLEGEIGVALFLRSPRGLQPTEEGRALYLEALRLLQGYTFLEGFARNLPKMAHSRLRIGCIPSLSSDWLPRHIGGFLRDYPETRLSLRSGTSTEIVQLIARGELDLGISHSRLHDDAVEKSMLFDLRVVCVVPLQHALAGRSSIDLADLHGQSLIALAVNDEIQRNVTSAMLQRGFAAVMKYEVYYGNVACRIAEETGAIAVLDYESARRHDPAHARIVPLSRAISTPMYLLRNRNHEPSLAMRQLESHIIAQTEKERSDPANGIFNP